MKRNIILLNSNKKRVRFPNGELTPCFEYMSQAFKYIDKYNMLYATPVAV